MDAADIRLVRGEQAERLLADAGFVAGWEALAHQCPWATALQRPGYATAWYRTYRSQYEPLIILAADSDGTPTGLLALATEAERIVAVGDEQAEYQAWISRPLFGDQFPRLALDRLTKEFHCASVHFRYLPAGTPTAWLSDPEIACRCILQSHQRPLLHLGNGGQIAESLAKKNNKNKLRQLQKLGAMRFEEVTDAKARSRLLSEAIPLYDVRHLAMRGVAPFSSDPLMRQFAFALLREPNLLHVTTLHFGSVLASAHVGVRSGREMQMGLVIYNPWLARSSPGKFHIFFLARMLREQGYEQLDLTAGGDAYKERFASGFDTVQELTIFPGRLARWRGEGRDNLKRAARRLLLSTGITPNQARAFLERAKRWTERPAAETSESADFADNEAVRRDCVADLLCYHPGPGAPTAAGFIADAMRRIEHGVHVYSHTLNGTLLQLGWLEAGDDGRTAVEVQAFSDAPSPQLVDRMLREIARDIGGLDESRVTAGQHTRLHLSVLKE